MSTYNLIIAVDPGRNGGIAQLDCSKGHHCVCFKMPDEAEVIDYFRALGEQMRQGVNIGVFVERVSGYIGTAHPGSTMFSFGENYGFLRCAIQAAGLPYQTILPKTWQRPIPGIELFPGTKLKAKRKKMIREEAQRRYPEAKVTLHTSDAIMIADWARREG